MGQFDKYVSPPPNLPLLGPEIFIISQIQGVEDETVNITANDVAAFFLVYLSSGNYQINNTPIGLTTPSQGKFTNLSATVLSVIDTITATGLSISGPSSFSSVPQFPSENAGYFFAGPASGVPAAPGFRAIAYADIATALESFTGGGANLASPGAIGYVTPATTAYIDNLIISGPASFAGPNSLQGNTTIGGPAKFTEDLESFASNSFYIKSTPQNVLATGSSLGTAFILSAQVNVITGTSTPTGCGVQLPATTASGAITATTDVDVWNVSGNPAIVYPSASSQFFTNAGLGVGVGITIGPYQKLTFSYVGNVLGSTPTWLVS